MEFQRFFPLLLTNCSRRISMRESLLQQKTLWNHSINRFPDPSWVLLFITFITTYYMNYTHHHQMRACVRSIEWHTLRWYRFICNCVWAYVISSTHPYILYILLCMCAYSSLELCCKLFRRSIFFIQKLRNSLHSLFPIFLAERIHICFM